MLFRVVIKGFSKEINDDLEALLDEITPLYKARFEELPTQLQVIVDSIALNWDPMLIEQLRNETRYENNQLSPQLKRLTEAGWIEKIVTHEGKGFAYQISERFFNIWFLMRRSSRRQKKELYCLSKFLESFYGDEIFEIAKVQLHLKACNVNHVTYNLAIAEILKDETIKKQLIDKSYEELRELAKDNPEILKAFDLPAAETSDQVFDIFIKTYTNLFDSYNTHLELQDYLTAKKILEELVEYTKPFNFVNANVHNVLGNLYQKHLNDFVAAETAYKTAINMDKNYPSPWNGLGYLYQTNLINYQESESAYKTAISLDEQSVLSWYGLGNLYQNHLHNYAEAEKAYKIAIGIDRNIFAVWNDLGLLYQNHLNSYHEAEKAFQKAIEIDEKSVHAWYNLGLLYSDYLKKYPDAEQAYLKAIELNENDAFSWNGLGNLYQDYLYRYEDAKNAYTKAIEIDSSMVIPKLNLVFLIRDKFNNFKEAESLFFSIKDFSEANDSYYLNKTLFELYKQNKGLAYEYFEKALDNIREQLPKNTQDDWWRFGAVVNKLGYGKWLTDILEEKGFDIILSPYYVAVKAMNEKDTEGYLNSKAVEIREPARKIMEIMKSHNS
jgi:tetratricopeptide (TPR) repeat protein